MEGLTLPVPQERQPGAVTRPKGRCRRKEVFIQCDLTGLRSNRSSAESAECVGSCLRAAVRNHHACRKGKNNRNHSRSPEATLAPIPPLRLQGGSFLPLPASAPVVLGWWHCHSSFCPSSHLLLLSAHLLLCLFLAGHQPHWIQGLPSSGCPLLTNYTAVSGDSEMRPSPLDTVRGNVTREGCCQPQTAQSSAAHKVTQVTQGTIALSRRGLRLLSLRLSVVSNYLRPHGLQHIRLALSKMSALKAKQCGPRV